MKLTHTEGNILASKIVAAAKLKDIVLDVSQAATSDYFMYDVEGLCLELPGGVKLFSSNAACAYLMGEFTEDTTKSTCNEIIQWEEAQFRPVVLGQIAVPDDAYLQKSYKVRMDTLSTMLPRLYNGTGNVSTADIALWAMIHVSTINVNNMLSGPVAGYYERLNVVLGVAENITKDSAKTTAEALKPFIDAKALEEFKRESAAAAYASTEYGTPDKVKELLGEATPTAKGNAKNDASDDKQDAGESFRAATEAEIESAKAHFCKTDGVSGEVRVRDSIVLPKKDPKERNILITSALPYVNNVPHLGNIIGCVLSADAYSRFTRVMGYNSVFVCGTDEYGTTTETKALSEGLTPQEICDKYHKLHADIYEWFNIGFDKFGRTTTPKHTKYVLCSISCVLVVCVWDVRMCTSTCLYSGVSQHVHVCVSMDVCYTRCAVLTIPVLQSGQFACLYISNERLAQVVWNANRHIHWVRWGNVWCVHAYVYTVNFLHYNTKKHAIYHVFLRGTPVPLEGEWSSKVFYVWFDAPIGYISITANYTDDWKQWWRTPENNVELYQFMAKDNVTFHGVIFPTSLIGTGKDWVKVKHINSVEYLNYEDSKFSKSRGIGVFGNDAQDTGIKADVWRFYLLWVRPENNDSIFSWNDFLATNNNILNNNLGNFVHRALSFVNNTFNGAVPTAQPNEDDYKFIGLVNTELAKYIQRMEACRIREAAFAAMDISKLGNQYLQAQKPWVLAKSDIDRCGTVVSIAANLTHLLASLIHPYMPESAATLLKTLDLPMLSLNYGYFYASIPEGHPIGAPEILFSKIEQATVDELKVRFAGVQSERDQGAVEMPPADPVAVAAIEAQIKAQGLVVRELKNAQPIDKTAIGTEVQELLRLKKELTKLTGEAPAKGK
ncbi:hypothetical protein SARC_06684 [Sphaeroforma arctica JP610]|uniref:methionine--tRNA ligase n=1 Tax=Sphaeroforma arctica JP610 TaxID=667725 RepID=A0A0L0FWE7_9EUKA|nr:hypothetical protein SARC_06684 [Sphaeroforma arctica JP610]KNC80969.1 hypothetical protein SARC_06684 [Sphaeroforma arctica JP610]|eukprot:XP_014154871.1 hypothetical protein SARC_06684 [Sphaeroforma arctica JP610]